MFSEKTRLVEKRENPFYGSYKENNVLEELHWQNKRKKQQLGMVAGVVVVLIVLAVGIILAITLPSLLGRKVLDPPDVDTVSKPSNSILKQFKVSGVSSELDICSEIGNEIIKERNGTAVDAAVAMALCFGVTAPQSSGLGGGLFMAIYSDGEMYALNARETAPAAVDVTLYDNDSSASVKGGLAVGVPGELVGLWEAHKRFGKVQWADLVKFATDLAQTGFPVSSQLAHSLNEHESRIKADPVLREEFVNPATDEVWTNGSVIHRPRLGRTLQLIGESGVDVFYNGSLASNIVSDVAGAKGIISMEDLSSYRAEWVEPVTYTFKNNLTMFSLPFPSSGPIVAMALGILDGYGKKSYKDMTPMDEGLDAHRLTETLKFAHAHRSRIGDPNFADLDNKNNSLQELLEEVLSKDYMDELRERIEAYKTFDDPRHYGGVFAEPQESGTVHISIIGAYGDAVSLTTTINLGFGAGFMGNLTGIIFNNELNDFSFANSTSNKLPNPANFMEPGKRPASSMAPCIVINMHGQPVLATGAAGGTQIVPSIISTSWRAIFREMDIKTAIDYPRFMPNSNQTEILYEYGLPGYLVQELQRRGHKLRRIPTVGHLGNVNSVCRTKRDGIILANADFRKGGGSAGY